MSSQRTGARTTWVAVRALALLTLLLGLAYPLAITAVGQLALPAQANGSLARVDGVVVGSSLIGQSFADEDGVPLPEWFQPRPSAANYDAGASVGSNWGPENPDLVQAVQDRRAELAAADGVPAAQLPADALTASASGLDPHISPEYALLQVSRVAKARGLNEDAVRQLVESTVQSRDLGYLGEPTVNVLELNMAVAKLGG